MPETSVRRRILGLVRQYPGIHLRELAREADISEQLASYHVERLEVAGLTKSRVEDGYRRIHAAEGPAPTAEERKVLHQLRQPVPLQLVFLLLEEGSASNRDAAERLDVARSTVSYHAGRLRDAGLLTQHDDGRYVLVDAERVEHALLRWEPAPALAARFADLWSRFYGRR